MFTTPTKNQRTKKNNTSEYTMLLNVLTAKFDLEKTNHAQNPCLIVLWFHNSILARPSVTPYLVTFHKSHFAMGLISKE